MPCLTHNKQQNGRGQSGQCFGGRPLLPFLCGGNAGKKRASYRISILFLLLPAKNGIAFRFFRMLLQCNADRSERGDMAKKFDILETFLQ